MVNNIPPNDKSLREINEVQNFKKVKVYGDKYRGKITLDFIKNLHGLILDNIDIDAAGMFRRIDDVCITGCDIPVTPVILIIEDLTKLINGYNHQIEKGVHPFEAAVLFHYHFELIHPFTDGNGRVGREIFNSMLKRAGYPRLLFLGEDRSLYILSLQLGNQKKCSDDKALLRMAVLYNIPTACNRATADLIISSYVQHVILNIPQDGKLLFLSKNPADSRLNRYGLHEISLQGSSLLTIAG